MVTKTKCDFTQPSRAFTQITSDVNILVDLSLNPGTVSLLLFVVYTQWNEGIAHFDFSSNSLFYKVKANVGLCFSVNGLVFSVQKGHFSTDSDKVQKIFDFEAAKFSPFNFPIFNFPFQCDSSGGKWKNRSIWLIFVLWFCRFKRIRFKFTWSKGLVAILAEKSTPMKWKWRERKKKSAYSIYDFIFILSSYPDDLN